MSYFKNSWIAFAFFGSLSLSACDKDRPMPSPWKTYVKTAGQVEPIPIEWLQTPEAKIAHDLILPDQVPKPVPFDFDKARWLAWLPGNANVARQYFDHLCKTEAGEWINKRESHVAGIYFARPQSPPSSEQMTDPYGLEMPWIQRIFYITGDNPRDAGAWLIRSPGRGYKFVEQPRRDVAWQRDIGNGYVKMFGYERAYFVKEGQVVADWNEKSPMQVRGVRVLESEYGYTWRGVVRKNDRYFNIAGGELLIYNLSTKKVLAVRRQYLISGKGHMGRRAMWEVGSRCPQIRTVDSVGAEFAKFSYDTLSPE